MLVSAKTYVIHFTKNQAILFLIATFLVFISSGTVILGQSSCATAVTIVSLPYSQTGLTNCGLGNSYGGTPTCLNTSDFNGEDYVLKYTPSTNQCINLTIDITTTGSSPNRSGIAILNNCPTVPGTSCVVPPSTGSSLIKKHILKNVTLVAGTTYYIIISAGNTASSCMNFNLKMDDCTAACINAPVITSLPYIQTGLTNCGLGNSISGAPLCINSSDFSGEDYVLKYTPSTNQCINLMVNITTPGSSPSRSGVAILNNCPVTAGAACVVLPSTGGASIKSHTLNNVSLIGGTTYYIIISSGNTVTDCMNFDLKMDDCAGACVNASVITSLPYNQTGLTNCGLGKYYSGTPSCLDVNYFGGEDYVLKYTPAVNQCINVAANISSLTDYRSGLAILNNCPTVPGTSCVASFDYHVSSNDKNLFVSQVSLTAGITYYILISAGNSAGGGCIDFDLNISDCTGAISLCKPSCANMDFETNSLSDWSGTRGEVYDSAKAYPAYISVYTYIPLTTSASLQHTIMTGGTDQYGLFPKVAPGGNYSLRLGDDNAVLHKGATLEQTFMVTAANTNFVYKYAAVLQNPNHKPAEQPFFRIDMFDANNNVITCSPYLVVSGPAIPNFFKSTTDPSVFYRPWTSAYINLTAYVGQCVTIRYTVGDCSEGGHFGYVYIDNTCAPMKITGNDTICIGQSTILTAPEGAVTYNWSTGESTQSITVSPTVTTTYSVTITSNVGGACTLTLTDTVVVLPAPTANFTVTTSPGNCSGSVIFNNTSINGIIYTWDFGDGSPVNNLQNPPAYIYSSGTYTITLTVSNGVCNDTAIKIITVNSLPVITVNSPTICLGGSSLLTANGASTYLWSTGETTSSIIVTPASTTSYSVTGTTSTCSASTIATVTITPPCGININTTSSTICEGSCATIAATVTNGALPYSYLWNTNATTSAITQCPTTTTSYTVTATDNAGLTTTAIASITVNALPIISVPNTNICPGGSVILNATGADTYTWSPGSGLSSITGNSVTATPAISTTYTVVGTTNSCTGSTTVVVNVGALVADAGPDVSICSGTSTNLNASGGSIFTWIPATGLSNTSIANPVASPAITTTYTVNISGGSCSDEDVVVVTINPITTLNAASVDATCNGACNGQLIVIPNGGTSPYSYSWSNGCINAACNTICAGTYTINTTDAEGCTASATTTVNAPQALSATISAQTNVSCFGLCNGSASVTVNSGSAPYAYSWNSIPAQFSATGSGLCAGTYSVTVTDAIGCSVITSVTITQPDAIVISSPNTNICTNDSAMLYATASGGNGQILFTWTPATGLSDPNSANPIISPSITTAYTVTGTDINSCTGITSVVVTVEPIPVISVPNDTICKGSSTTLTAAGASMYAWSPTTGLSSGSGQSVSATPTVTTTYTVIGTNAIGCTGITTVVVTVNPELTITSTSASICLGDSATLNASGGIYYTWNPLTGLNSSTGSIVTAKPSSTIGYIITGTGPNGCTATATATVVVHPKPVANFIISPNPVTILNPTVYFSDNSSGAVTWNWSFGDPNNNGSTSQNSIFTYDDSVGHYQVRLIITNQFGCSDTIIGTIDIKGEYTFFIPNTFTPNGDRSNDDFSPKGTGIDETDYNLWIFDRWGNMIWNTSTWGEAWDGRANGGANIAQIDTYIWKVHVREKDSGIQHKYIGHVNIVK